MAVRQPDVVYECDNCKTTYTHPATEPTNPPGWVRIQITEPPIVDWFCSWDCLQTYAGKRIVAAEALA